MNITENQKNNKLVIEANETSFVTSATDLCTRWLDVLHSTPHTKAGIRWNRDKDCGTLHLQTTMADGSSIRSSSHIDGLNGDRIRVDYPVFTFDGERHIIPPYTIDIPGYLMKRHQMTTRRYISTVIEGLDQLLGGGLRVGELTILAGTPSIGTSCLCSEWLGRELREGYEACLISLSDMEATVIDRMCKQMGEVPVDIRAYLADRTRIGGYSLSMRDMESGCSPEKGTLMMIDGGTCLTDSAGKLTSHFAVAKGLQEMAHYAQSHGVALVVTLPLSAPSVFDVPTVASVGPSRACVEHAYHIIGLYRYGGYGSLMMRLMKNKSGGLGEVEVTFDRDTLLVTETKNEKTEEEETKNRKEIVKKLTKNGKIKINKRGKK